MTYTSNPGMSSYIMSILHAFLRIFNIKLVGFVFRYSLDVSKYEISSANTPIVSLLFFYTSAIISYIGVLVVST